MQICIDYFNAILHNKHIKQQERPMKEIAKHTLESITFIATVFVLLFGELIIAHIAKFLNLI